MRKTMIAFAAAFAVCTATMTSGTTAAFARGGGSFGGGTHGFGAALDRVRQADVDGNAVACAKALDEAKQHWIIPPLS